MKTRQNRSGFVAGLLLAGALSASHVSAHTPSVEAAYAAILANPKVVKTLEDIKADDDRAFAEQKRITEIPAPPYKEKVRAEYYLKRFQELGFKDASIVDAYFGPQNALLTILVLTGLEGVTKPALQTRGAQ
jgi:tripeptide aminopeptidase